MVSIWSRSNPGLQQLLSCNVSALVQFFSPLVKSAFSSAATCQLSCNLSAQLSAQLHPVGSDALCHLSYKLLAELWSVDSKDSINVYQKGQNNGHFDPV
jgi:hypothetical protein